MAEHLHHSKKTRTGLADSGNAFRPVQAAPAPDAALGRRCILLVDASSANRRDLRSRLAGHEVLEAESTTDALRILSGRAVDLAIVAEGVPDLGGAALCGVLRRHHRTRSLSVLVLSDELNPQKEALALIEGADDFVVRPLDSSTFRARVQSLLRRATLTDSNADFESVFLSLAQAVEARDPATGQHCQRVAVICSSLGSALGLPPDQLITLQRGAFLHDIGKIAIPDHILFKTGPLSPDEWSIMQNHTTSGERICSGMRSLTPVLPIIRNHHERWDGTGYPDRLRYDGIPLLARVLQIADIFDALTTQRPYKDAFSPSFAMQVLRSEAAAGWRDSAVVDALCDVFPQLEKSEALSNNSLLALSLAIGERKEVSLGAHAPEPSLFQAEPPMESQERRSPTIYRS